MSASRITQMNLYLPLYITLNSKWIKDLNLKQDTLNLREQRIGNILELVDTGDNFLKRSPMTQVLMSKINEGNLMKLKSFYITEDTISRSYRLGKNLYISYM